MSTRRDPVAEREAALVLWGSLAIGVVLRLLVFRGGGFATDVGTFQAWAERLAQLGPARFYAPGYFSDYPPAFLYVLWLVGALFDGEALRLAVKALSIPADIAIAVLLARVVGPRAGAMAGALAGALWMLQPGAIFAGPYWGQVDSWGTLPFIAALVAAGAGRWGAAGALAAIAGMVKPQFGLVAIPVGAAAAFEVVRPQAEALRARGWSELARWRPLLATGIAGLAVAVAVAVPFGLTPGAFVELVRSASETYPYTSLFAFNGWSIVGDFWKPDDRYVFLGGILLGAGLVASVVPLWWRRDTAMLLAAGAFVALAFYFLPTRAHERYIFPAFALLAPFAVARPRILWPYVTLAIAFFASLYFAFTRYPQNVLAPAPLLESTLFGRNGQIAIALVMVGASALIVWRLVRGEAHLRPAPEAAELLEAAELPPVRRAPWRLPEGFGRGHAPTRRDIALALLVALAVLATRGYRLDWPRDMYFDEVYHARTAMELIAQREPYEWTHPHLAKEIIALGILAFGGDRVERREAAPRGATAFAVSNEGQRAYGQGDGGVSFEDPATGVGRVIRLDGPVRALAFEGSVLYALTDRSLTELSSTDPSPPPLVTVLGTSRTHALAGGPPTSFAVSRGRALVGTASGLEIHAMGADAPPLVLPIRTAALTAKPDANEVFVADDSGAIRVVDATTGKETARAMAGGAVPTALAYARAADRIFAARSGETALDWYEPPRAEGGTQRDGTYGGRVELSNGRTGDLAGGITALALVPRSQLLYALAGDRLVVVEPHGVAPFAAIPVSGRMLGVDGTHDEIRVLGDGSAEIVPTGRHAFAWRLPGVVLAAFLAFMLVLLARRLFASAVLPGLVGVVVVLDGSMFAQARIGMNDVYVATFIVAGWYFVVAAHAPRRSAALDLVIAGALFGLAAASKWAAAYALAGLGLFSVATTAWAWSRGRPGTGGPFDLLAAREWKPLRRAVEDLRDHVPDRLGRAVRAVAQTANAFFLLGCFLVIPLAVYLASYLPWFGGPTIPFGWDLVELTRQMYWYHSGLTAPHPAGSPWWSWPLVLKPVYWYLGQPGGNATAVIYDAGNIVLYWGGIVAVGWAAIAAVRARSVGLAFLLFAMLTQYVAWIPISRVLFFYHFFTALPFYLLILAAGCALLWETGRARLVTTYLAIAAAVFVFFYPFISGQPVPGDQAAVFYVLPTWQYDCQFYPSFHCETTFRADIPLQLVAGRIAVAAFVALLALAATAALQNGVGARFRAWASHGRRAKASTG